MLNDNDLLNFNSSRLAHADAGDARRLLREHGDVFRAQLVAARWLEGWLERLTQHHNTALSTRSPDYMEGFDDAIRDVVAHLRQGDLIPGGVLYDEELQRD